MSSLTDDIVAVGEESLAEVAAEEAGAAGDQDAFARLVVPHGPRYLAVLSFKFSGLIKDFENRILRLVENREAYDHRSISKSRGVVSYIMVMNECAGGD
jgi:hypothetical protein